MLFCVRVRNFRRFSFWANSTTEKSHLVLNSVAFGFADYKYTFDDRLAMGGMLVFLFAILLFIAISYKKKKVKIADYNSKYKPFDLHQYLFLLIAGTFFTLAFNGTMLNRSTMCYTLFIAFAIPNAIKEYSLPTQTILGLLFHIIMLVFFYMFCLAPKSLDIVPYVLGTDIPFLQ